jgi:predicted secreted acid phosphatase
MRKVEASRCRGTAKASLLIDSWKGFLPLLVACFCSLVCRQSSQSCDCKDIKVPEDAKKLDAAASAEGYSYTHTGEYKKEFHARVAEAKSFCAKYRKEHPDQKLAVVSDIDETVLDNRGCTKGEGHGDWSDYDNWITQSKAPKLKESANFLKWARKNGFCVFFITGRHEKDRGATIINLHNQGIDYDGLYLRAADDNRPASVYKPEARQKIEDMGFLIVENMGDQFSDLAGGHSLDCEKIPNRMYVIK